MKKERYKEAILRIRTIYNKYKELYSIKKFDILFNLAREDFKKFHPKYNLYIIVATYIYKVGRTTNSVINVYFPISHRNVMAILKSSIENLILILKENFNKQVVKEELLNKALINRCLKNNYYESIEI